MSPGHAALYPDASAPSQAKGEAFLMKAFQHKQPRRP